MNILSNRNRKGKDRIPAHFDMMADDLLSWVVFFLQFPQMT